MQSEFNYANTSATVVLFGIVVFLIKWITKDYTEWLKRVVDADAKAIMTSEAIIDRLSELEKKLDNVQEALGRE